MLPSCLLLWFVLLYSYKCVTSFEYICTYFLISIIHIRFALSRTSLIMFNTYILLYKFTILFIFIFTQILILWDGLLSFRTTSESKTLKICYLILHGYCYCYDNNIYYITCQYYELFWNKYSNIMIINTGTRNLLGISSNRIYFSGRTRRLSILFLLTNLFEYMYVRTCTRIEFVIWGL